MFGVSIGTILGLVSSVLSLILTFMGQAKSRDDNEAGQLSVALTILSKAKKDLDIARGIESTITQSVANDPSQLHKPDEFTKP